MEEQISFSHYSVLLNECIEGLAIRPDGIYIDGTAGGAGHSREIAKRLTTGRLIAFDKDPQAVEVATALRDAGIRTQLYTEKKKFKAKIGYADKLGIPYVVFLGEDEIANGVITLKDMTSGEQKTLPVAEAVALLKDGLAQKNAGTVILEK